MKFIFAGNHGGNTWAERLLVSMRAENWLKSYYFLPADLANCFDRWGMSEVTVDSPLTPSGAQSGSVKYGERLVQHRSRRTLEEGFEET